MSKTPDIVFLFDVDNTLIDNDRVQAHLKEHLAQTYGTVARDRYWEMLEGLRNELGYVDYLGALERFRIEAMHRPEVLRMSNWLVDYPSVEHPPRAALLARRVLRPRASRGRVACGHDGAWRKVRRPIHGRRRGRRRGRCDGNHARYVRDARPVRLNRSRRPNASRICAQIRITRQFIAIAKDRQQPLRNSRSVNGTAVESCRFRGTDAASSPIWHRDCHS
jgi:hypothetical protein